MSLLQRIENLWNNYRHKREFKKFVKSKSVPDPQYFNGLDLSKQLTREEIQSIVKSLFEKHFNEPEAAKAEFERICRIDDAFEQKEAFRVFDRKYSKYSINPQALVQINSLNDLIYSFIVHQDMCYWVGDKCEKCGGKLIKMVFNSPPYTWQERYGWRCYQYLCTDCYKFKVVGGLSLN